MKDLKSAISVLIIAIVLILIEGLNTVWQPSAAADHGRIGDGCIATNSPLYRTKGFYDSYWSVCPAERTHPETNAKTTLIPILFIACRLPDLVIPAKAGIQALPVSMRYNFFDNF